MENTTCRKVNPVKFSDLYPRFDIEKWRKKLAPYCKKTTSNIIKDLLKIIDNVLVYTVCESNRERIESDINDLEKELTK